MPRPPDLPPAHRFPHGTRARYVTGCRCAPCRTANTFSVNARTAAIQEAAKTCEPNPGPQRYVDVPRRRRDGIRYMARGKACPGTGGRPCVRGGAWLRGKRVCMSCVEHATTWNGLVPAGPVLRHLRKLSRQGVGYKAVAAAASVAVSGVARLLLREKHAQLRAQTARRILEVDKDAVADHGLVPSGPTYLRLKDLGDWGLTSRQISQHLGARVAGVFQVKRPRVLAITALKIQQLHLRTKEARQLQKRVALPPGYWEREDAKRRAKRNRRRLV